MTQSGKKGRIPRFLLNDIVRFWRTMAVDYASKRWQRTNKGWAMRNVKSRMSRKLLFVAGLLLCFMPGAFANHEPFISATDLESEILSLINLSPLEILAMSLVLSSRTDAARKIIGAYDEFLACIDSPKKRKNLEDLPFENAETNPFQRMRGKPRIPGGAGRADRLPRATKAGQNVRDLLRMVGKLARCR